MLVPGGPIAPIRPYKHGIQEEVAVLDAADRWARIGLQPSVARSWRRFPHTDVYAAPRSWTRCLIPVRKRTGSGGTKSFGANPPPWWGRCFFSASPSANPAGRQRRRIWCSGQRAFANPRWPWSPARRRWRWPSRARRSPGNGGVGSTDRAAAAGQGQQGEADAERRGAGAEERAAGGRGRDRRREQHRRRRLLHRRRPRPLALELLRLLGRRQLRARPQGRRDPRRRPRTRAPSPAGASRARAPGSRSSPTRVTPTR